VLQTPARDCGACCAGCSTCILPSPARCHCRCRSSPPSPLAAASQRNLGLDHKALQSGGVGGGLRRRVACKFGAWVSGLRQRRLERQTRTSLCPLQIARLPASSCVTTRAALIHPSAPTHLPTCTTPTHPTHPSPAHPTPAQLHPPSATSRGSPLAMRGMSAAAAAVRASRTALLTSDWYTCRQAAGNAGGRRRCRGTGLSSGHCRSLARQPAAAAQRNAQADVPAWSGCRHRARPPPPAPAPSHPATARCCTCGAGR
jgi:hypothetical protein